MLEIKFYGPYADRCKPDRLVSSTFLSYLFFCCCSRLLAIKRRNSFNFDHFPFNIYFTHELCNILVCNGIAKAVCSYVFGALLSILIGQWFRYSPTATLLNAIHWHKWKHGGNVVDRAEWAKHFSYNCDVIMSTYKYFMQMPGYVRKPSFDMLRPVHHFKLNQCEKESQSRYAFNSWPNDKKG